MSVKLPRSRTMEGGMASSSAVWMTGLPEKKSIMTGMYAEAASPSSAWRFS